MKITSIALNFENLKSKTTVLTFFEAVLMLVYKFCKAIHFPAELPLLLRSQCETIQGISHIQSCYRSIPDLVGCFDVESFSQTVLTGKRFKTFVF